jgi:hypothetical protein
VAYLAFPSDATGCADHIGVGGVVGAPLRTHLFAHASTDTVDISRSRRSAVQSFEYVTSHTLVRFLVLMQVYISLYILRSWSYVSCVRYMVTTPDLADPSAAISAYAVGLCWGAIVVVCAGVFMLQQNDAFWFVRAATKRLRCNCRNCCRNGCCSCRLCNRDSPCYQCLLATCCIEEDETDAEKRERQMRALAKQNRQHEIASMGVISPDVVFSGSDDTDQSSDGEDIDELVDDTIPFTSLRWRYPLTRTIANVLVFGVVDDAKEATTRGNPDESANFDRFDGEFERAPTDARGVPLETEAQLTAARVARRGRLPPDPFARQSDRAEDEKRTFSVLGVALWAPNAIMSGVDWYFYTSDEGNPAYNGFFWLSFVIGFVFAIAAPWFIWQAIATRFLERRSRADGTSAYSERYAYDREEIRQQHAMAAAWASQRSFMELSLRPSTRMSYPARARPFVANPAAEPAPAPTFVTSGTTVSPEAPLPPREHH